MTNATNPEHEDRLDAAANGEAGEALADDAVEATPEQRIEQLEAERAAMETKYQRSLTDFQNYVTATPEQVAAGVRVIQDELVKALTTHGVEQLAPQPGDEFDPNLHEALMRQPAGEHAPGSVVQLLQPGYAVGERVIRPAKVAVAEGDG